MQYSAGIFSPNLLEISNILAIEIKFSVTSVPCYIRYEIQFDPSW